MQTKYMSLVLDETDRLFEQGAAGKNDDLVLAAGRIRGYALLASLEPEPEVLPAVRPIPGKPPRKQRAAKRGPAELASYWAQTCPACGASPGHECISIRSTSSRRAGEVLAYMHAERTGGSRAVKNIPPAPKETPRIEPDHPVFGGALASVSAQA